MAKRSDRVRAGRDGSGDRARRRRSRSAAGSGRLRPSPELEVVVGALAQAERDGQTGPVLDGLRARPSSRCGCRSPRPTAGRRCRSRTPAPGGRTAGPRRRSCDSARSRGWRLAGRSSRRPARSGSKARSGRAGAPRRRRPAGASRRPWPRARRGAAGRPRAATRGWQCGRGPFRSPVWAGGARSSGLHRSLVLRLRRHHSPADGPATLRATTKSREAWPAEWKCSRPRSWTHPRSAPRARRTARSRDSARRCRTSR